MIGKLSGWRSRSLCSVARYLRGTVNGDLARGDALQKASVTVLLHTLKPIVIIANTTASHHNLR